MSEANVAILRAGLEAFNRRDFDAALERFAEDATWEPFLARTETPLLRGVEEIRAAWMRQFDVLDLRLEEVEIVADDDQRVVTRTHMVGRGQGSDVTIDGVFAQVYVFDGEWIVAVESHESVDDALRSAGLAAP